MDVSWINRNFVREGWEVRLEPDYGRLWWPERNVQIHCVGHGQGKWRWESGLSSCELGQVSPMGKALKEHVQIEYVFPGTGNCALLQWSPRWGWVHWKALAVDLDGHSLRSLFQKVLEASPGQWAGRVSCLARPRVAVIFCTGRAQGFTRFSGGFCPEKWERRVPFLLLLPMPPSEPGSLLQPFAPHMKFLLNETKRNSGKWKQSRIDTKTK